MEVDEGNGILKKFYQIIAPQSTVRQQRIKTINLLSFWLHLSFEVASKASCTDID